ncbi:MAG: aldo/keto reductase [Chloroflexi bacterium]|nr:aldo/keto reductase [Chloroflexota bacterium]
MRTVPLANTRVSAMCLGAMYMGWRTPAEIAIRLLDQYVAAGGTFIDTANVYGRISTNTERVGCISENLLGQWMRERRNHGQLFIATKVGASYIGVEAGLRASQVIGECEKSLKRLGIETIDLYYAHIDDRNTSQEETLEAFDQLVRSGKVRNIGASNFLAWRLEQARWISRTQGWAEYVCIQQRHSYLRPVHGADTAPQVVVNRDLLDYCQTHNVALLAYSPLVSGVYAHPEKPLSPVYAGRDGEARLRVLRRVARELNATPNQIVLAWMMHSTPTVVPIFAASNPEQMTENLGALNLQLDADTMRRLDDASGMQSE